MTDVPLVTIHYIPVRCVLSQSCCGVQIALKSDFLSTSHCLLYGEQPGAAQAEEFRSTVMRFSKLPATVINAMEALPTNAHPMSVVMSAVVAMGALHPEQNPALAGNAIHKDKGVQDTQIVRLLGAMPSIAAYAYYRCVQQYLYPVLSLWGWKLHGFTVYPVREETDFTLMDHDQY